jgi:hypothetical protein
LEEESRGGLRYHSLLHYILNVIIL